MKKIISIFLPALIFFLCPTPVFAHAFGAVYRLPIPFELYLLAAGLTLIVSFLLIGVFSKHKVSIFTKRISVSSNLLVRLILSSPAIKGYKIFSFSLFILTILTGLFGDQLSAFNFSLTFFWIIFVVGFTYLVLIIGNIWEVVNPWKILIEGYEKLTKNNLTGIIAYPNSWQYYPAYILYVIFIAIELFGGTTPMSLAVLLIQYTIITCFAVFLFGKRAWFTYGDFFSVFYRFVGYASLGECEKKNIYFRVPYMGLVSKRASSLSMILFILFMLSSTAFDGFRETNAWFSLYWDWFSVQGGGLFAGDGGFHFFEILGLVVSPFLFLVLYLFCIACMKYLINTKQSVQKLAYTFAFSLIPIALVYNIAHYFTLLVLQGQSIIRLMSDPFGFGWNIFSTASYVPPLTTLPASFVWHFQVSLILLGHIISVFVSHRIAIKVFTNATTAVISQIPLLVLMVLYTIIGLWILSQPIAAL